MQKEFAKLLIISIIVSSLISIVAIKWIVTPTPQERIRDYYMNVNLAEVSPHLLKERVIDGENITIVDVRDPGSFAAGHIPWAINIPSSDPDLVAKFREIDPNSTIVTYCYTQDCMASRQVGKILVENGIYTQHLNVGYAEWEAKEWTWNVFEAKTWACPLTGSVGC